MKNFTKHHPILGRILFAIIWAVSMLFVFGAYLVFCFIQSAILNICFAAVGALIGLGMVYSK